MARMNWVQGLTEGLGNFLEGYELGEQRRSRQAREKRLAEEHASQEAARSNRSAMEEAQRWMTTVPNDVYSSVGLSSLGRRYAQQHIVSSKGDYASALAQFNEFYPQEQARISAGGGAVGAGEMFPGEGSGADKSKSSQLEALEGAKASLEALYQIRQQMGEMGMGAPPGAPAGTPIQSGMAPAPQGQLSSRSEDLYNTVMAVIEKLADPNTNAAQLKASRTMMSARIPTGKGHTPATR